MKRLLFVDKDLVALEALRGLFESSNNYEVVTAENGQKALQVIESNPVDLVISELRLPGMDGYQLLSKIKNQSPNTTRVMISDIADEKMVIQAMQRSIAKIWVSKPWDDAKILELIEKLLETETLLSEKNLMSIINGVDSLPTIQPRYQAILEMINNDGDLTAIALEIEKDPAIASKVLHIINSAFFNIHTGSIKHAVTYLGLQNIRNVVYSTSIIDTTMIKGNSYVQLERIWDHSFLTNQIVNFIYTKILKKNLQDVSVTAGLLHNLGSIFFLKYYPQKYLQIMGQSHDLHKSLVEWETDLFHVTHQETGGYLLQWWDLPHSIIEAALYHHSPLDPRVVDKELVSVVHIAQKFAWDILDNHLVTLLQSETFDIIGTNQEEFEQKFAFFSY